VVFLRFAILIYNTMSATLPYKVIVSNVDLDTTGGAGMSGFNFLSLDDAKAFATALTTDYSSAYVYIWDGSSILAY
jgi:hypothetical protein